jgi:hypothetical protein
MRFVDIPRPTTEYRVTCANIKLPGHKQDFWPAKDLKAAEKALEGFVSDAGRLSDGHWRLSEYPYKIQTRTVTQWETV